MRSYCSARRCRRSCRVRDNSKVEGSPIFANILTTMWRSIFLPNCLRTGLGETPSASDFPTVASIICLSNSSQKPTKFADCCLGSAAAKRPQLQRRNKIKKGLSRARKVFSWWKTTSRKWRWRGYRREILQESMLFKRRYSRQILSTLCIPESNQR